jgi:hypothetical protein
MAEVALFSVGVNTTSNFDVVAACLFSPTGKWTFKFGRTDRLPLHASFPDRLNPMQHVDASWSDSISGAKE